MQKEASCLTAPADGLDGELGWAAVYPRALGDEEVAALRATTWP